MQRFLVAGALSLLASAAGAQEVMVDLQNQTITQDMQTLIPHIGGRVQPQSLTSPMPAGAKSFTHEWPALYFEGDFTGDTIFLKFDDPSNEYRARIDDLAPITLAQPGMAEVTINGLAFGRHHILLEKVTESTWIVGTFGGFYLPRGANGTAAPARARQIEFIGDSDMTGYGIRSATRECTQDKVRLLSDAQIAYPALLAKDLNADYQVNAISGRGMIRNYGGINPQDAMIYAYPDILPDVGDGASGHPYSDATWQPQIIVIALGDNDFSTPLLPIEKWQSNKALIDDFTQSFTDFLTALYQTNPSAALIMVNFDPFILNEAEKDLMADAMETSIQNSARALGFRAVNVVSIASLAPEKSACDYHASKSDQRRRADWLAGYIAAHPEYWQQ